jgi:acyl-CoA synthetase (AMP-forming)/AMP-acid ligase II
VVTGGAPVPERLLRAWLHGGCCCSRATGCPRRPRWPCCSTPAALTRIGSAGRPPLLVDVRIVHPDGTVAGSGETGELVVRGPNVMAGYWRRPEATREVLSADGWLRTGDAAHADDEGYVWIVDRVADRLLVDGRPVHPGGVERVLTGHPSVEDAGVVQGERGARPAWPPWSRGRPGRRQRNWSCWPTAGGGSLPTRRPRR